MVAVLRIDRGRHVEHRTTAWLVAMKTTETIFVTEVCIGRVMV